jgi:hypothetical protein
MLRLVICEHIRFERNAHAADLYRAPVRTGTRPEVANGIASVTSSFVLGAVFAQALDPVFDVDEALDVLADMISPPAA